MKIGLVYDLRDDYLLQGVTLEETAEFDSVVTIDAISDTLNKLGYCVDRIGNIEDLAGRLVAGDRWSLVFNMAEGKKGFGRESQVPALLDAFNIPYTFSEPHTLAICLHKGTAKRLVRDFGVPTVDFYIVHDENDISNVHLRYPLFVKPVAEGTGKGIDASSVIYNDSALAKQCLYLLEHYNQPVLIERFLSGREYTVGMLGTGDNAEAIGVLEIILMERSERNVYSFFNKEHYEKFVEYKLVEGDLSHRIEKLARKVWKCLGCRDAGRIDFREDDFGIVNFLEANPLAGMHPTHSDLPILCGLRGISYEKLIERITESVMQRLKCREGILVRR